MPLIQLRHWNEKDLLKMKNKSNSWAKICSLVYERDKKCVNCGIENPNKSFHVHHKIPRRNGGSNELDNLQLLCSGCHGKTRRKDERKKKKTKSFALSMEAIEKLNNDAWELHKTKSSFIEKLIMDYKKVVHHGSHNKQSTE
jgi:5-methylcytosine-specific restriction endonuclease McrA